MTIVSQPKGAGPRALLRQLDVDGALENTEEAVPKAPNQEEGTAVAGKPEAGG